MGKRDFTPLVMWFCLLTGIIVVALARLGRETGVWSQHPINLDTVFISFYILWLLVEFRVSRKDVDTGDKKRSDSATCQLYGLGQALTFLTALWFASVWQAPHAAHFAGISLFLLGVCYRLWAIHTLGRFYSHRVQTVAEHRIVASGPYRYTRHPAYAGMLIANAGICIYFFNQVTLAVFLFVLMPAIFLRIFIEEKALAGIEGYAEFAEKRKRLFPALW
jgi:protein-S-isoprenylcysteine O-methyltransferase Ste14